MPTIYDFPEFPQSISIKNSKLCCYSLSPVSTKRSVTIKKSKTSRFYWFFSELWEMPILHSKCDTKSEKIRNMNNWKTFLSDTDVHRFSQKKQDETKTGKLRSPFH